MRSFLFVAIAIAVAGVAHADTVTLIPLQTPNIQINKISGNGAYAVASIFATAGFRWTASTGAEELITTMDDAEGINNTGAISGSVAINGGASNNGDDLGAYALVGGQPILLTSPLQADSDGYDISDDGTVVGLSFGNGYVGPANAFVWAAATGMTLLPVNHPANYSRANRISADGRVIAGWNDNGGRNAVIWQDRVPLDVVDVDGNPVSEADGISSNGQFVVGGGYTDINGNTGSWRWNKANGAVELISGIGFAFGVSDDGKTIVGNAGFFDPVLPARAALIWQQGIGTMKLVDYLTALGVTVPTGWDPNLAGGFAGISSDGSLMGGWTFGPSGNQSYLIKTVRDHIFTDGFDGP